MVKNPDLLEACKWLLNAVKNGTAVCVWDDFSVKHNRFNSETGICGNLMQWFDAEERLFYHEDLDVVFAKWPKFSGDLEYPVPSLSPSMEPSESFIIFPCWEDEGLTLRIELLEFMVQELEREDAS